MLVILLIIIYGKLIEFPLTLVALFITISTLNESFGLIKSPKQFISDLIFYLD